MDEMESEQERISGPLPGMEFIAIPSGFFFMGSMETEFGHNENEVSSHRVFIKSFYMMTTPVTQSQWFTITEDNPSYFKGDDLPVERVSWNDVQEFILKLKERGPGRGYRLPTEAEWEYACRAGSETPFNSGDTINTDQANYNGNYAYKEGKKGIYRGQTTPINNFPPNSWGLYDMHGNVLEWCEDRYHNNYQGAPDDGSAWVEGGRELRILRGGSWNDIPENCRSALRSACNPDSRHPNYGFRLVCEK